nr:hypothetical protein CFP56_00151 [Quercus suber]
MYSRLEIVPWGHLTRSPSHDLLRLSGPSLVTPIRPLCSVRSADLIILLARGSMRVPKGHGRLPTRVSVPPRSRIPCRCPNRRLHHRTTPPYSYMPAKALASRAISC